MGVKRPTYQELERMVEKLKKEACDRTQAEEKLRENERRFRAIADYNYDWENWVGNDGRLLWVNPAVERMTGYSPQEVMSMEDFPAPLIVEEDITRVLMEFQNAVQNRTSGGNLEIRFRRKDGQIIWGAVAWQQIFDENGESIGHRSSIRDITERKRAVEELRRSEERFKQVANNLCEWIWEVDTDGLYTYASPVLEKMLGYKPEEVVGKMHFYDLFTPEKKEKLQKAAFEVFARKGSFKGFVNPNLHKNGTVVILETSGAPVLDQQGRLLGYCGGDIDITERKRVEKTLQENEKLYRLLAENTNDMITSHLPDGTYLYISPACRTLFGYDPQELLGTKAFDLIHPEDVRRVITISQEAVRTGELRMGQYRHLKKDGQYMWVETVGKVIKNEVTGDIKDIICVVRDITERRQAEEAIKVSEEKYRRFFETSIDCVFLTSKEGRWVDLNDAAVELFGYSSREELMQVKISNLYAHPGERAKFISVIEKYGYVKEFSVELRRKDGTVINTLITAAARHDAEGNVIGFLGTIRDITESKRLEENLKNEQQELKLIIDSSPIIVFYKDKKGKFIRVNKTFAEAIKLPEEEFVGKTVFDFYSAKIAQDMTNDDQEVLNSGRPKINIIEQYESASGIRWVQTDKVPICDKNGIPFGLIGFAQDITERKQAEEIVQESEGKYRSLIETTNTGYVIIDLRGKVLDANDEYARLSGHESRDEILGRSVVEWTAAYDRERNAKAVEECVRQGFVRNLELDYIGAKGETVPVETNATLVTTKSGPQILALCRDIAERKGAEEALKKSEVRFRSYFELSAAGVAITSPTKGWIEVNDRLCEMLGYSREAMCQRSWTELTHPNDIDVDVEHFEQVLAGEIDGYSLDKRFICSNGETIWTTLFVRCVRLPDGSVDYFVVLLLDITERKQAEQQMLSLQAQLQQSQKMEAIGQLAGGVAHDFNNLLTVISVQAQLAVRGLREGDPLKEKLKDIEQAADRAGNLTRQLLAFSRRQILEMKVANLNIILEDMEKMLRRVIGEHIELKVKLGDDLGMVKVDPGQMEQVIVNLAINAKDAMPKGGKLFLETANAELDKEYTRSHAGMMPGAYILLSITDTGIGMSKEVQEQIFDPFFTTKEKGRGTGLGLSTVYGIVKQSGGDICVYSEPNKETTFKIYLPRVFEPQEELKKEAREEISRGTETILVVEDEDAVRRLAIDILRKQGYRLLEASEGGEALVRCEKEKDPIDLILTDLVMPHMGGPELIERLRQVRKDFKVLYMTGYTDESIVQHEGILEKGIELIHKPFTINKLARKVREVLDKN